MIKRKMSEFVTFIPGVNSTRAEKQFGIQKIKYYDQNDFERDLCYDEGVDNKNLLFTDNALKQGDVIISNSMRLATMVGKNNAGKVPSLNFTKVEFKNNGLDKQYFIYLFNYYNDIKRQKERELQGSAMARIPIKALNELIIPVVPMEEQKKIGLIYSEIIKLQNKLGKYAIMIEQFAKSILEENLKGK
ncbi:MAG: restriction endonuclease subunit S [Coprobacillus cateniformis]|uniref:restriction endonuclease subunit S n=1 Tax=Longibaculum muris TaxID=1796628 RepID=UPI0029FF3410|nr:restriction endonuclease subunit S [Coprobacillus cateniformis]